MRAFLLSLLFLPTLASAATISFDLQDSSAGVGTPFKVAVNATADEYANAFSIALHIPEMLTPVSVSDGNSVILLWVDAPHFDETTRTFSFSGVIPNGFAGEEGRLLTLTFIPTVPGEARITLLPESRAYAGEGEEVMLLSSPISFSVVAGKENISNALTDMDPPEAFVPEIVSTPQLFGGLQTLVFSTTDKGSGIAYFEVQESWFPALSPGTGWKRVESPYPLRDQFRGSFVAVRAVDHAGNLQTQVLPPERLPLPVYIVPVFLFLVLLWWIRRRYAKP